MFIEDPHRARVSSTTTAEKEIGRDVKEELRHIALDYDTELKSTEERSDHQTHMLSDGNIITVGAERFRCESIFQAKCHWQRSQRNARTSSFQNVMKCDVDIRVNFYANVVL